MNYLEFEKPLAEIEGKAEELRAMGRSNPTMDVSREAGALDRKADQMLKDLYKGLNPWQKCQVARHPDRPHCRDYIEALFTEFTPLAGDRNFADDHAIMGGLARFNDQPVLVMGQEKGHDTKTRIERNFGMARPEGYRKAIRLMDLADRFRLPVITLVDTPGFYPGKDLEWRGMIRHGAQLVFAYGRATVPRICVILRKSYGGAYIVMDSKEMGNDLCLAWPWAELAVMGAGQAAAILQRRATPEEKALFEEDYSARLLNPYIAAERGYVDAVIDPADTRTEIAAALEALDHKRERLQPRSHDNTPL